MKKILIIAILVLLVNSHTKAQEGDLFVPWKHYVGLKIGTNAIVEDGVFGFRFGFNYELTKLNSRLGYGILTEFMFSNAFEFNLGFPFYLHDFFHEDLNFVITPGIAFVENVPYGIGVDNEPIGTDGLRLKDKVFRPNFMLRLGGYWDFYVYGREKQWFMISPELTFDVISYRKLYIMLGVNITVLLDENIYRFGE
jgi:hypothetical protein